MFRSHRESEPRKLLCNLPRTRDQVKRRNAIALQRAFGFRFPSSARLFFLQKKSKKNKTFFQKPIAFLKKMCYNNQVARTWPLSQAAKTSPSHGEGMGSIPVGVTKKKAHRKRGALSFCAPSRTHTAPRRGAGYGFASPARRSESLLARRRAWRSSPQAKFR